MKLEEIQALKERVASKKAQTIYRGEDRPLDAGYAGQTLVNVPGSAARYAKDLTSIVTSPIQTTQSIIDLGSSLLSLLPGVKGDETLAKEVGKYYADRFGGATNIAKTFRDDPVGFLGDLSLVALGGAGVAKVAGKAETARKAAAFSRYTDPLTGAAKVADVTGKGLDLAGAKIGRGIQTAGTGVKEQVFKIAFDDTNVRPNPAFREGISGKKNVRESEIIAEAEAAYSNFKKSIGENYRTKIGNMNLQAVRLTPDNLNSIQKAFDDTVAQFTKGEDLVLPQAGVDLLDDMKLRIDGLLESPARHNLQGYENLKEFIDLAKPSASEGNIKATAVHSALRNRIAKVLENIPDVPNDYAAALSEYSEGKKILKLAETELGLGGGKKSTTVLNNLRKTLALVDNVPEEALLKLPGGLTVRDKLAGVLAREIIPGQYLRAAGAAGTIGLGAGATLASGIMPVATAGVLFSPRTAAGVNRLAGRVRKRVPQIRESLLEPLRQPLTTLRPAGTVEEEVYEPLQRRGLL